MEEHRGHIGSALLASVAVFLVAGVIRAAQQGVGWEDPVVIALLAAAAACFLLSLWVLHIWATLWGALKVLLGPSKPLTRPSTPRTAEHSPAPTSATKKAERQFARRTPKELWDLFGDLTDIQAQAVVAPFIGTWLTVTGAVESVMEFGSFVQVTLDRGEDGPHRHHTSYLMFPSAEWREPLARLATGDPITARV